MKSRIARDEVNVEVDSGPSGPELGTVLSGLRSQYEEIVKKNKDQAEQWYRKKVMGEKVIFLSHDQRIFFNELILMKILGPEIRDKKLITTSRRPN